MQAQNRNHFLTVVLDVAGILGKLVFPVVLVAFGKLTSGDNVPPADGMDITGIFIAACSVLLLLIIVGYSILKWYRFVYEVDADNGFIRVRQGILVVKKSEFPVNRIQTVNISQKLLHRLLRLSELKIDTGNASQKEAELTIVVAQSEAEKVKETLMLMKNGVKPVMVGESAEVNEYNAAERRDTTAEQQDTVKEQGNTVGVSIRSLFLMGLTRNAVFAGIIFIFSAYTLFNDVLDAYTEQIIEAAAGFFGSMNIDHTSVFGIVALVIAAVMIYLFFSFAVSICSVIIKYYGFSVTREGRNITISYGLLDIKKYIIPVSKIRAVYIRQNLMMQLLKASTLQVETVGYGNEKGEEAILVPFALKKDIGNILTQLLPEYVFEENLIAVPHSALSKYIFSTVVLPFVLCCIASVVFPGYGLLSFLSIPFFTWIGYLSYRHAGIAWDDMHLCMRTGAFSTKTSILLMNSLQTVAESTNFLQRRKKLFTYEVSIQGNTFGTTLKVKHLSDDLKDALMRLVVS